MVILCSKDHSWMDKVLGASSHVTIHNIPHSELAKTVISGKIVSSPIFDYYLKTELRVCFTDIEDSKGKEQFSLVLSFPALPGNATGVIF